MVLDIFSIGHYTSHHNIRVTINVLRNRMNNHIGSQGEGTLNGIESLEGDQKDVIVERVLPNMVLVSSFRTLSCQLE